jgi:prepilin-type N-terminal cleavage/methylation domain-containing protein
MQGFSLIEVLVSLFFATSMALVLLQQQAYSKALLVQLQIKMHKQVRF